MTITSETALPDGAVKGGSVVRARWRRARQGRLTRLLVDDVAKGRLERTVPYVFSMGRETLDVESDTGSAVRLYDQPFPFTRILSASYRDERQALDRFPGRGREPPGARRISASAGGRSGEVLRTLLAESDR